MPSWTPATVSSLLPLQQCSFAPHPGANSPFKPQQQRCLSPTVRLASLAPAIPAPPFGIKSMALSSGSLSSSKCFFFRQELIQLCFPFFYGCYNCWHRAVNTAVASPSLYLWHYFIAAVSSLRSTLLGIIYTKATFLPDSRFVGHLSMVQMSSK